MECPSCHRDNPETVQYCVRCHAPLRFICPACKHVQPHGGRCEQCGVEFAKYLAMMLFQVKSEADRDRARFRRRSEILKQVVYVPLTGGLYLLKYVRALFRRKE